MIAQHNLKRLLSGVLCSALLLSASTLTAQEPVAIPADLLSGKAGTKLGALDYDPMSLKVAKVQPVIFSDSGARTQVSAVASRIPQLQADDAQKARISGSIPAITMPAADSGEQGFGFGGSSTELDTVSLQYGYLLGMLPIVQAASADKFKETVATLDSLSQLNQFYGPELQAAVKAYLDSAKQGQFNDKAYMEMLGGATQGMASTSDSSVERRHGYLLLGLWSGFASIAVESGSVPENLAASGNTLVMLLEKDAAFGGSDVQLAAKLKLVIAELKNPAPDKAAVQKHIMSFFDVQADQK
jgi:hypothetical protein